MRVGIIQEGETEHRTTHAQRYRDLLKEVMLADEYGFDFWGTSEQHFLAPVCTVSAPETLYPWMAAHTNNLTLRHMSVLLPFGFNHPLRVAERIATLDIVSNGRAQLCTARSNNIDQLQRFGSDPARTRQEWEESLEVIVKALSQDEFEHKGRLLHDIPPTPRITPHPIQQPHPPVAVVGTSVETNRLAGEKGIGVMACDTWFGWEYMSECLTTYKNAIAAPNNPISSVVNDSFTVSAVVAHCAPTMEEARESARFMALNFLELNLDIYPVLAKKSPDYAYMDQIRKLESHRDDLDYLMACSPTTLIGDPDYWVERLLQLKEMGADEVVVRLDGVGHERIMRAIELVGRYVLPEIRSPSTVVRREATEEKAWA